jgi:hypothetical protein
MKQFVDVLERSIWTFGQTFLATLGSDDVLNSVNLSFVHKLEIAAIAGGIAVAKCLLALIAPKDGDATPATPGLSCNYQ